MEEENVGYIKASNHEDEVEAPHLIAGEVMINPTKDREESDHINDDFPLDGSVSIQSIGEVLLVSKEIGADKDSVVATSVDECGDDSCSGSGSNNGGPAHNPVEVFPPPAPETSIVRGEIGDEISSFSHKEQEFLSKPHDWEDVLENMREEGQEIMDQEGVRRRSGQTKAVFKLQEIEHLRHRIAAASYRMGKTDVASLFDRMDREKRGHLELEELSIHLRRLMPTVLKRQIAQFFRAIGKDDNHRVSKDEFVAFIDQRQSESPRKRGVKGGQSPRGGIQAAGAMSGNKPKTPLSNKKPPRDPSQSTLMVPTKARINDLAIFLKNKAEIKDEDDPWWEKRPGKLDGLKDISKKQYAKVESRLYQTTHSYEAYKTAPTYIPRSLYRTSPLSSSGGTPPPPISPGGSTGGSVQVTPKAVVAMKLATLLVSFLKRFQPWTPPL